MLSPAQNTAAYAERSCAPTACVLSRTRTGYHQSSAPIQALGGLTNSHVIPLPSCTTPCQLFNWSPPVNTNSTWMGRGLWGDNTTLWNTTRVQQKNVNYSTDWLNKELVCAAELWLGLQRHPTAQLTAALPETTELQVTRRDRMDTFSIKSYAMSEKCFHASTSQNRTRPELSIAALRPQHDLENCYSITSAISIKLFMWWLFLISV